MIKQYILNFEPITFFARLVCTHEWYHNNNLGRATFIGKKQKVVGYSFCARCGKRKNYMYVTEEQAEKYNQRFTKLLKRK